MEKKLILRAFNILLYSLQDYFWIDACSGVDLIKEILRGVEPIILQYYFQTAGGESIVFVDLSDKI